MKDYYQILELTPEATFQNVIQNYNQYIKMFNQLPTLLSIQKEQLKEIKEAFFILGNYHKRRQYDNKREGYNVDNDHLLANSTAVESTANEIDMLSNGFKLRIATDPNVAEAYIYMAFADSPFVSSTGVPTTAR